MPSRRVFICVTCKNIKPREDYAKMFTVRLHKCVFRGEAQPSSRNSAKERKSSSLTKVLAQRTTLRFSIDKTVSLCVENYEGFIHEL